MAGKPSLQFYPGDWWRSNEVKGCSMCTQGVWFNLLMRLFDSPEQGKIRDTKDAICRMVGCTLDELEEFIDSNKARHFANVTFRNNKVTIINRRMYRAYIERESTKKRVQVYRERQKRSSNSKVTLYSSTSTSSSKEKEYIEKELFDKFWKQYPRKDARQRAVRWFEKNKPTGEDVGRMVFTIERQKKKHQRLGCERQFIPLPETWLNDGDWRDAPTQADVERQNEQKDAAEKEALEKRKEEMRQCAVSIRLKGMTADELKNILASKDLKVKRQYLALHWYIKELLSERK